MPIVLAADPMCSWCYGFAKALEEARQRLPRMALEVRVAGLWAGSTQWLDEASKRFRLSHWARVEAAAGVPFNREAFLARQDFVYDSGPVSVALVAGRVLAPNLDALRLLRALQHAFYVDGLDTTAEAVLAPVLEEELRRQGHHEAARRAALALRSSAVQQAAQADYQRVRSWQLSSFPKLLSVSKGPLGDSVRVLLDGFAKAEQIVRVLSDTHSLTMADQPATETRQ